MTPLTPFEVLQINNPIVANLMLHGTAEDCAVALAAVNEHLMARIAELESIVPRKVRLSDGSIVLWRCPDEFVPEPV
jgi:hypothetical protein